MSEINTNETETPTPEATPEAPTTETPTSSEGMVKRDLLIAEGKARKDAEARLAAYESAAEEARKAELAEQGKYQDLLKAAEEKNTTFEAKIKGMEERAKALEVQSLLVANGIQDPTGLVLKGALALYDGTEPGEWVKSFTEANPKAFETPTEIRTTSANGGIATGEGSQAYTELINNYKKGSQAAAEQLIAMNRDGKIPDQVAREIGLIR